MKSQYGFTLMTISEFESWIVPAEGHSQDHRNSGASHLVSLL